jgi:hypothetical protein
MVILDAGLHKFSVPVTMGDLTEPGGKYIFSFNLSAWAEGFC